MTLETPPSSGSPDRGIRRSAELARWTFAATVVVLLPLMIMASFDFGVSYDERSRHKYGELILEYFKGLRSRSSFLETGEHLYSGLFDTICATLEQWLPGNRYVIRHVVNATFGWVGVLFCGRLAARLFGTWSGVLAMILLAASPRYFADSMNNPKDLPFAALTVVALYYFSTVSPTWPYLSRATAIKIAVALALALNVRSGALLYLGYLGALVAVFVVAERSWTWRRLADTAARLAAVALAVLILGTIFWPWAQGAPLTRPFQALLEASDFPWGGLVVFNGREYSAPDLPWYYPLLWFLISTPPVVLAGLVLSVFVARGHAWSLRRNALWAVAVLPLLLIIIRESTLYDGVRHLLFIYPILVVLAVSGWSGWLLAHNRPWLRWSAAGLLAAGLVNVLAFDIRFHPNETVYFNELVGGPRGAFAKFEMDYWGNCVLEAVKWGVKAAELSGRPIAMSGNPSHLVLLNSERFHQVFFTDPRRGKHELTVLLNRGSIQGVTELAAQDALYRVQTPDGVVLCAVLPGPAFAESQSHISLPPARSSPPPLISRWLDFRATGDRSP